NLLYSLPGRTPQFSVLRFSQEAVLHCNVTSRALKHNSASKEVLCHSTMNQSLSLILRAIRSAERLMTLVSLDIKHPLIAAETGGQYLLTNASGFRLDPQTTKTVYSMGTYHTVPEYVAHTESNIGDAQHPEDRARSRVAKGAG
ncbi:hypothetical protein NQZ68_025757, partial [Dissostichus eleginoides]